MPQREFTASRCIHWHSEREPGVAAAGRVEPRAEVLGQQPCSSAVSTAKHSSVQVNKGQFKTIKFCSLKMKLGPECSSVSLKSKHNSKASAPSRKHMNSLQGAAQIDLGSSLEFNGHKNT